MTSIERTAYPQFRRLTSARVLHVFFTPAEDEVAWARERTETPGALLALLVDLKCFQKMARFCSREEIPQAVTDHVRHCLGLSPEVEPDHGAARTARWHRGQVRKRQGVTRDPRRARTLAETAIREAAQVRNHPPDLINVALERIVEASLELRRTPRWMRWRPPSGPKSTRRSSRVSPPGWDRRGGSGRRGCWPWQGPMAGRCSTG